MTCYHPLKRFVLPGYNPNTGNPLGKVVSYNADLLVYFDSGNSNDFHGWKPFTFNSPNGEYFLRHHLIDPNEKITSNAWSTNWQPIPCGQCLGCRIDYSRNWANRIMLESLDKESYFITLTYNPQHIPLSTYFDIDTGEQRISYNLSKKDVQNFIKRLRSKCKRRGYNTDFKYFLCGEYGSKSARSHYHIAIVGLHIPDLEFYKDNFNNDQYFHSRFIEECWTDNPDFNKVLVNDDNALNPDTARKVYRGSIGYVVVAPLSWQTAAYTARYVMKKRKGKDKSFYDQLNIEPEFCLMSKGIGKEFYIDNKNSIYDTDEIILSTPGYKNGSITFKPPRYFDKLYELDDMIDMMCIKKTRQRIAENNVFLKMKQTNLPYLDLLKVEEDKFKHSTSRLVRNL